MTNQSVITTMPPAHPRPVVRDPDAKRRRILEAARRLLVERDFQDIVLDDVAKRADVAKGTLFLYFKSKEELFSCAFADTADALGLELAALGKTGAAGKELVLAAARVVLAHFDQHRDFLGSMGSGRMPSLGARARERMLEKYRENQRLLRGLLVQASKDGGRSLRDPEYAAAAFIGLCRSAAIRKVVHGRDSALEKEAQLVVTYFLDGSGLAL